MLKNFFFILFISVLFSGCLSTYYGMEDESLQRNGTDFSTLIKRLSYGSIHSTEQSKQKNKLYITDFVNISNLDNNSKLGFILSNELKAKVTSSIHNQVIALELAKNLRIGFNGSKILTRNLDKLKSQNVNEDGKLLVGSYAITTKQLIIYLKLIDIKTGAIVTSSSVTTKITNEILDLEGLKQSNNIYVPMVL